MTGYVILVYLSLLSMVVCRVFSVLQGYTSEVIDPNTLTYCLCVMLLCFVIKLYNMLTERDIVFILISFQYWEMLLLNMPYVSHGVFYSRFSRDLWRKINQANLAVKFGNEFLRCVFETGDHLWCLWSWKITVWQIMAFTFILLL